jgi:hypothetical protein
MLLTIGILMLRDLISARANYPGNLIGYPLYFPDRLHRPMERPYFFRGFNAGLPG